MTRAYLASLYGHTGRREKARAMCRELLEIKPNFSLELRQALPFKDPFWFEQFTGGLIKTGLPV